ncbi:MAG: MoxR family ATPase [Alicyclobacillaceae bacterium]|uniref:AAA family ATPase n=1 Tax=Alicyclobacillus sp. SP_1 TaxID=2942475 RepID=UPI00215734A2|nr:MoxR family ATPase [Alicyclobacillus sp. SP_1]MCY0889210.1 MoxR family ATPase [Alicyclobacillaceae bacterium]
MSKSTETSAFQEAKDRLRDEVRTRWTYSAETLRKELIQRRYFLPEESCRKLVTYLSLNKPVGLRGEPGVGKSELPEQLARVLEAEFVDIECHSQLEAMDIGVSWNGFKQMVDAQTGRNHGDLFTTAYLNRTPLLTAVTSERPVVVRVDEVDKLNENTSNFFLRFLDKRELVVHDLVDADNVLSAKAPIYVFLTSNEYRPLDIAMMRRVAWMDLRFPPESEVSTILQAKTGVPRAMADRIAYLVQRLRQEDLRKPPSIGEALDWTRALMLETDGHLTWTALRSTLGLLLKYESDEKDGWEAMQEWLTFD